ncbi:MAG: hypothetical protein RIC57_07115 [Balneola sp.]
MNKKLLNLSEEEYRSSEYRIQNSELQYSDSFKILTTSKSLKSASKTLYLKQKSETEQKLQKWILRK